jgi:Fe2+ transport system protein FeoA
MPINLYSANRLSDLLVVSVPANGLLENIGLRTGARVSVQNRYALGGPVLLRVEDAYSVALGKDIAVQIGVVAV